MNHLNNIRRLFAVIDKNLFTINATLDYDRVTEAIIKLAEEIIEREPPTEFEDWDLYAIGEYGSCDIGSFIVGAYWHYSEWHAGQDSQSYLALSQLGQIFSPGMADGPEPESSEVFAYDQLNNLAKEA